MCIFSLFLLKKVYFKSNKLQFSNFYVNQLFSVNTTMHTIRLSVHTLQCTESLILFCRMKVA